MDQHGSSARIRGALAQESGWRRVLAYGFKLLSGFGAIAVAAGIPKQAAQLVGIAVAINVLLDTIFSNQPRLLIVTKAKYALAQCLNLVRMTAMIFLCAFCR